MLTSLCLGLFYLIDSHGYYGLFTKLIFTVFLEKTEYQQTFLQPVMDPSLLGITLAPKSWPQFYLPKSTICSDF